MRPSLFFCFLLAVMSPFQVSAGVQWTKVGLTGGDVTDLASFPSNPDIMLACVAEHGIYRSTDRGNTWMPVINSACNDISISEDNIAFVAGDSGVMVSHDAGQSWKSCLGTAAWRVVAYRGGIVAAGERIYTYPAWRMSRDNGGTWEAWAGTENTFALLFHTSGAVYRSAYPSIYRSSPDDWNAWTKVFTISFSINDENPDIRFGCAEGDSTLFGYSRYIDMHPGGSQGGGVYRSVDAGLTWKNFSTVPSVTAMERSRDLLIAGTPEGALYIVSIDLGKTSKIGSVGGEINAIDARRFEAGELVVASKGGIFKTGDGGLHWRRSDAGITYPEVASVRTIPLDSGGERIIVATKSSGIFYSDDGGGNWIWSSPDVRALPGLLKVSETTPRRIYAAEASINVSRDDGATWEAIPRIPTAYYYGWYGRTVDIDIDPRDSERIAVTYYDHSLDHMRGIHFCHGRYVGESETSFYGWEWKVPFESGEQYKSQFSGDGGLMWVSANRYGEDVRPLFVAFDDTGAMVRSIAVPGSAEYRYWLVDGQSCYVFNAQEKKFRTSHDLGATWESMDLNVKDYNNGHRVYPYSDGMFGEVAMSPDGNTLYLTYPGNGVLASGDGGRTWIKLNEGFGTDVVYQLAFSKVNPSVTYAATGDGLYRMEGSPADVQDGESRMEPSGFSLHGNTPNPFNSSTVIRFDLAQSGPVRLSVYSVTGQKVRELVSGRMNAGRHSMVWDGRDGHGGGVSSGVYISRLESGGRTAASRMLLIK